MKQRFVVLYLQMTTFLANGEIRFGWKFNYAIHYINNDSRVPSLLTDLIHIQTFDFNTCNKHSYTLRHIVGLKEEQGINGKIRKIVRRRLYFEGIFTAGWMWYISQCFPSQNIHRSSAFSIHKCNCTGSIYCIRLTLRIFLLLLVPIHHLYWLHRELFLFHIKDAHIVCTTFTEPKLCLSSDGQMNQAKKSSMNERIMSIECVEWQTESTKF